MSINMINDIFIMAKKQFLKQYSYMNEEGYEKQRNDVLNQLFSREKIIEYNEFLKNEVDACLIQIIQIDEKI